MKKKTKISVIMPMYNAEKYIAAALDSVLNQTFHSYEILVINDGSTDDSLSIAEEYCRNHPDKIQIISQENAGAGAARNLGVKKASGSYVLFMDSDDTVEKDMLSQLYASAIRHHSEVVFCPFYRHGLHEEITIEGSFNFSPRKVYTGEDFIKNSEYLITTCTKLYQIDFIRRFEFPSFWFEDVALLPVMMSYANRITYVPYAYYHYLRHESSTVSSISDKQILGSVDAVRYIKEHANPEIVHEMAPYIAHLLLFMCVRRPAFADLYVNLLTEYKGFIEEHTDFAKHPHLQNRLKSYFQEDYAMIPKQIFYDHFGKQPLSPSQEENVKGWQGTLVEFDAKIICLNEENCDITEHPLVEKAYHEGRFQIVGQYFKCKRLLEEGGIALSADIRGYKYIPRLLTRTRAFFAFYDDVSISSHIYASAPGEPVIREAFALLADHLAEPHGMSATLSELLLQKNGASYSYQWESNFKSKYMKIYGGRARIYSTNVLTWDYGLGTTIAAVHREPPQLVERDGERCCEVNAFYYHTLQKLTRDYLLYKKDQARQDVSKQNVRLQKKIAYFRGRVAEQVEEMETQTKRIKLLKEKNAHYLSLINDIKRRKLVWLAYRISMKFSPPKEDVLPALAKEADDRKYE